jgi:hypothetical protein
MTQDSPDRNEQAAMTGTGTGRGRAGSDAESGRRPATRAAVENARRAAPQRRAAAFWLLEATGRPVR